MSLRVRFAYPTASSLAYSIERLGDGLLWDYTNSLFTATPALALATLPEDAGIFVGRYTTTLASTPGAQFTDGSYCITVHDINNSNAVVGELQTAMHSGDDAPVFPSGGGGDPWAATLGSYGAGTAGALVATNLDARVSSRGTFSGGAVASVAAPVTVGTNNDKVGYGLAANGLDLISIADPGSPANTNTWPKLLVAVWRSIYRKRTIDSAHARSYADDGTTINATANVSDDGTTQTAGASS